MASTLVGGSPTPTGLSWTPAPSAGGFIVHFFDRPLVDRLAGGFSAPEVVAFEEGDLPRRLWRVAQRKERPVSQTLRQLA